MKTCQTNEKRTLAMAYFKNEFRSVLYVDDFEASTKFYGEGLELRSNYSWDDGPDDRGVKYLAAGGVIEVIRRDPPIAQGSTTLMLEAEDVNACYQAMKKKDWLIFLEDLADRPYGIRCFRLLGTANYQQLVAHGKFLLSDCTEKEREMMFAGNAWDVYWNHRK